MRSILLLIPALLLTPGCTQTQIETAATKAAQARAAFCDAHWDSIVGMWATQEAGPVKVRPER